MTESAEVFVKQDSAETGGPVGNQIIRSKWLGDFESDPRAELYFPAGLPGFEEERRMLPVEIPSQRPLVYLHSLGNTEICFVALPVFVIDPGFILRLSEEERCALQLPADRDPVIGEDVLCLALLARCDQTVRVNLGAAVVINLNNGRGIQCVPGGDTGGSFHLEESGKWGPLC